MYRRLGEATDCRGEGSRGPQGAGTVGGLLHKVGSSLSLKDQGGLKQWEEKQEDLGPSASGHRARGLWGGRMLAVPTTSTPCPHTSPERRVVCSRDGALCGGQELAVGQRRGLSPWLPQG